MVVLSGHNAFDSLNRMSLFSFQELKLKFLIINRSGSSQEIEIEIITQMRDGAMYFPAVQKVLYFNRNETILSRFCLYYCYHLAWFSMIRLRFFRM